MIDYNIFFDKVINVDLNRDKMLIDVKLNSVNGFKVIDLEGILFIKEGLYFLKYRIKFNFFRKLYILLSKVFITYQKINRFVNQVYANFNDFIEKVFKILVVSGNSKSY